MNKRPFVIFGIFAAICVIAIPLLALRKEGDPASEEVKVAKQDEQGKALFATNCGACHTLEAAGTDGIVGPNLDDLIGTVSKAGGGDAFAGGYSQVINAVHCGVGGRMPAGILTDRNAQTVAGFVAAYAGRLSPDEGPGVDTRTADQPTPPECGSGAG